MNRKYEEGTDLSEHPQERDLDHRTEEMGLESACDGRDAGTTGMGVGSDTDTNAAITLPRSVAQYRPAAVSIPLPSTALASADALEKIAGAPLDDAAVVALNSESAALLDLSPEGLMPGLARSLVLMQALFTKLIAQAMEARNAGAQAALLRTALGASREAREIILLMRSLKATQRAEDERTVGFGAA